MPSPALPRSAGRSFDPLSYRDPLPSPWLIHALGPLVRHLVIPHILKLRRLELPAADLRRLRAAVRPGTAAFLGPVHPEFMTDWMIDKEVSRRVSPLMAHWASYEIVNIHPWAQGFWLRNNLIANAPGGGGKDYSVRWALAGHGVLLHPEGTASWHGDWVGPLVPGIVDMAWDACVTAGAAPVFVVPIAWKLHFENDVSGGLHREMRTIERGLELPRGDGLAVEARFAALQKRVLERRLARFGFVPDGRAVIEDPAFFDAQEALAARLMEELDARYGPTEGDPARRLHAWRRAARQRAAQDPEGAREDRAKVNEVERLGRFARALYSGPTFTQEQIAENLKQLRTSLLVRGFANAAHNLVPVAVAPRVARLRVPEPIAVHEARRRAGDPEAAKAELVERLRALLQQGLDELNGEIAPRVDCFRRPNPFHAGG